MMRKFILSLMLLSTVSAFADCTSEYERAAKNRNIRNSVIIGTASAALMGPFSYAILATAAIPSQLSVAAYFAGIITITNTGPVNLKSNFDRVLSAVDAAKAKIEQGKAMIDAAKEDMKAAKDMKVEG